MQLRSKDLDVYPGSDSPYPGITDLHSQLRRAEYLSCWIPDELKELHSLRTTFQRRRADILAYFDHPGTSNGPTEALNGMLEHLRGIALGFRNRSNYLIRSLLHAGEMDRLLQPYL